MTNPISLYYPVTHLVNEGKAVGIGYLDFSKVFDTVSHSILLEKLTACGFDSYTLCWLKDWQEAWAKTVVVNEVKSR